MSRRTYNLSKLDEDAIRALIASTPSDEEDASDGDFSSDDDYRDPDFIPILDEILRPEDDQALDHLL